MVKRKTVFWRYCWLVIKRGFTGVFAIADLLGVILLVLSLNQPKVPWHINLVVFTLVMFVSTFLVWKDGQSEILTLRRKIKEINDSVPRYVFTVGVIEGYDASSLLEKYQTILNNTPHLLEAENVEYPNTAVGRAMRSIVDLKLSMPSMLGVESNQDKRDRISEHVDALKKYEKLAAHTYKVSLSFESTRSDNNVEFEIVAPEGSVLSEGDNYIENEMPYTYAPSFSSRLAYVSPIGGFASKLYLSSYADGGRGYSKLRSVNASRVYNLFEDDFYITTNARSLKIKVTVHSEKLNVPQVSYEQIELYDSPRVALMDNSEQD
jgi:hypothetical protein